MTALQTAPVDTLSSERHPQGDLAHLPLNQIRRNPSIDPRKGRNSAAYADIRESIRVRGVIQAIIVRPIQGAEVPYEVVAGNTRFDASVDEGLQDIPAIVREMSDEEARIIAAIENLKRADLTPIEEAWHCVRLLEDTGNDHDEVCRILDWSRKTLDGRVLLSKCCDEVATALVQKLIKIGHAELLAPMVADEQRAVCKAIIERGLTVQATRERLMQLTPLISTARFDTTDCGGCAHNSQRYVDLFTASVGEAKCQNSACWENKTQQLIEVRLIEAKKEFGLVHTDLTLPTEGYVLLSASGPTGVGAGQINACVSCPRYGAVVSTTKGQEGNVLGGHCFDKTCHVGHVKVYQELIAVANGAGRESRATADAKSITVSPTAATKSGDSTAKPKGKPQEIKRSIKKVAFGMYGQMGQQAVLSSRPLVLAISIVSLYLDLHSDVPSEVWDRLKPLISFPGGLSSFNRAAFEVVLSQRPAEELEQVLNEMAACTVLRRDTSDMFGKSIGGAQSLAFIQATGMDPTDHFVMSEQYLKALTKPGILLDCKASGFDVKFDQVKGDKAFAKLASGKVDDLIKAILGFTEFSWSGYLPDTMKISVHTGSATE